MKRTSIRETIVLVSCLLFGLLLLPMAVFFVGQTVFGAYGGDGYGEFFASLMSKILAFDLAAWFLVLSPYLALQTLRLVVFGWRKTATM